MEIVLIISILALIDFILTLIWVYRWRSSKYVKQFNNKIPLNLIEANPIINHLSYSFGIYGGIFSGYCILFLIQIALGSFHAITGFLVILVLLWAIRGHIKNNLKTSNKHIIKMTIAYNEKLREKELSK